MSQKDRRPARDEDIERELCLMIYSLTEKRILSKERLIRILLAKERMSVQQPVLAVFFRKREKLLINRSFQVSGVPAKIMRKLLTGYVQENRCEFTYKEFLGDSNITTNPYNPNFSIRYSRLRAALEKWDLPIRLERPAKGVIRIVIFSKIEYWEEN